MKKTVFLLCLLVLILPKTSTQAAGNDKTFDFDNFNIVIENYTVDGEKGFTVNKTGTNPFYTIICEEDETFIVNGVTQVRDSFIIYGSTHRIGYPTYYDAFFIVLDAFGGIVTKQAYDYNDLEEIVGVYLLDELLVFHTEKSNDNGRNFVIVNNYFTSYDLNYNLIDEMEIGSEIRQIYSDGNYVFFNYDADILLDGGIRDDLTILLPTDLINIENNEIFTSNIYIEFLNEARLNNDVIRNSIYIEYPGNYKLVHNNREYNFVVVPLISGIEDNRSYINGVTPVISAGNILLNNDVFISGTKVDFPGNYELTINGVNGYKETYNFIVTSNMQGVINNHTYTEPIEIIFNGDGYLNNQFVTSPLEVDDIGEYILKIRGENNYLETYYFQIGTDTDEMNMLDFIQKFDIYILVIVLISGGIILKKK